MAGTLAAMKVIVRAAMKGGLDGCFAGCEDDCRSILPPQGPASCAGTAVAAAIGPYSGKGPYHRRMQRSILWHQRWRPTMLWHQSIDKCKPYIILQNRRMQTLKLIMQAKRRWADQSRSFRSPTGCAITYLILINKYLINYFILCLKGAKIITDRRNQWNKLNPPFRRSEI